MHRQNCCVPGGLLLCFLSIVHALEEAVRLRVLYAPFLRQDVAGPDVRYSRRAFYSSAQDKHKRPILYARPSRFRQTAEGPAPSREEYLLATFGVLER